MHEPIVSEALYDRVQEMRRQRATTLKPGRPSDRYVLRGLAHCRRCHAKMHGTGVGRNNVARYYCSSRRKTHDCDQPVAPADKAEQQLASFIAGFSPGKSVREEILRRLAADDGPDSTETIKRRKTLEQRLRRMRDLYELGDLDRPEYIARRNAINTELDTLAPQPIPDLAAARRVLEDFTTFWNAETDTDTKRQFLTLIFESVWIDERRIVAVQPKPSFLPFFENTTQETPGTTGCKGRERRG